MPKEKRQLTYRNPVDSKALHDILTLTVFFRIIESSLDEFLFKKAMAQTPVHLSKSSPVDAQQIYEPVQSHLIQVQDSLKSIVTPEVYLLAQSIAHTMGVQGKMLRPLLCLLVSGATGNIEKAHIETAAVAELIHVATLLHDDVLDESDTRRGRQTVRSQWGNKVSILSGDYLLAQASLKLSKLNNCRLVSIFAIVLSNLCEGEVEQVRSSYDKVINWDSYFKKSICKTASLFGACCESAGVINGLPEDHIQALKTFGEKFGIAFQVIDDLLDYTSSTERLGKPVLDDLKNGLMNAPVMLALEHFGENTTHYHQLNQYIDRLFSSEDLEPSNLDSLQKDFLALLGEAQAVEKTMALAQQQIHEALALISFLPESPFQKALVDLTRYATQRDY